MGTTRAQRRQATQNRMKAMVHPLRAEAFRLIRDRHPSSPKELARELEADTKDVSYHIRKLKEFNCVEEVGNRRVRGAVETFYSPTELHMIDTDEWMELVEDEPEMAEFVIDDIMQSTVDDYTDSRRASVVGSDEEFFLVRNLPVLDPKGIHEALKASQKYEDEIAKIAGRSAERHAKEGTTEIPVSSAIILFKRGPRPRQKSS
ncbi:MAG: hypothetical protein ACTHK6_00335 [Solirubrobacterales bacterium]